MCTTIAKNAEKIRTIMYTHRSCTHTVHVHTIQGLGMGPHQAMKIAERLYLQGYTSYPRTESSKYPESFDLKASVQEQSGSPIWGEYVCSLLERGISRPKVRKRVRRRGISRPKVRQDSNTHSAGTMSQRSNNASVDPR
jgi:DNA topoisomerase IA